MTLRWHPEGTLTSPRLCTHEVYSGGNVPGGHMLYIDHLAWRGAGYWACFAHVNSWFGHGSGAARGRGVAQVAAWVAGTVRGSVQVLVLSGCWGGHCLTGVGQGIL